MVQATLEQIIRGGVAGFTHVKPGGDFRRGGVRCDSGTPKYTRLAGGRQMYPFSFHFPHNERPEKADPSFTTDFHTIQFDEKGIAASIEMQREWTLESEGPRRNEIMDILTKRYGQPAAMYYYVTSTEGTVEMTWGTSIGKREGSTPALFGPKFTKSHNRCESAQENDLPQVQSCFDWMNGLRATYFAVGKEETDVLVRATLRVHPQSNAVQQFRLNVTDVAPTAAIQRSKEGSNKASSEAMKRLEEIHRQAIQPRF